MGGLHKGLQSMIMEVLECNLRLKLMVNLWVLDELSCRLLSGTSFEKLLEIFIRTENDDFSWLHNCECHKLNWIYLKMFSCLSFLSFSLFRVNTDKCKMWHQHEADDRWSDWMCLKCSAPHTPHALAFTALKCFLNPFSQITSPHLVSLRADTHSSLIYWSRQSFLETAVIFFLMQ